MNQIILYLPSESRTFWFLGYKYLNWSRQFPSKIVTLHTLSSNKRELIYDWLLNSDEEGNIWVTNVKQWSALIGVQKKKVEESSIR